MHSRIVAFLPLVSLLVLPTSQNPVTGFPRQDKPAAPITFENVREFASTYCMRCHGEKMQKGGLNLASFADQKTMLKHRKNWREVARQLSSGEMPPEDAK